ncbi:HAD-like protein [Glarea lozoyensis ATCC 20868]|uniref:HAD-like protein n=1 Tax=Glarea lozoyensis (strain ATCC 20868 / MF5171) TaxID=1116229 RepID=S3DLL1_GLAL2|nr:HAD-like protein [Glarea lozoyensis ATCC 20868]EPE27433.1 HAD-like protein [Glarea lozoyensis ATCC 20868]
MSTRSDLQYPSGIRAVFFDFMGTCLDWYSSITAALPEALNDTAKKDLAIAWREIFFEDIHERFQQNLPPESFDVTTARLLDVVCALHGVILTPVEKTNAVQAWHGMSAWADVVSSLASIKAHGVELFVLANGTMRLQLDLVKSSGLHVFDMLFSSELLGLTKPDPHLYQKAMQLVGVRPEECAMVAAHAYDLRAAKAVGMKTVYVRRWTEDTREDMTKVDDDVDAFIGTVTEAGIENEPVYDGTFYDLLEVLGLVDHQ